MKLNKCRNKEIQAFIRGIAEAVENESNFCEVLQTEPVALTEHELAWQIFCAMQDTVDAELQFLSNIIECTYATGEIYQIEIQRKR